MPKVDWLLADRGYDADWFRKRLKDKEIKPCIPGRKNREKPVKYDKRRYKRHNRIEIMFGRLKDWPRIATRYDLWSCRVLSGTFLKIEALTQNLEQSRDPQSPWQRGTNENTNQLLRQYFPKKTCLKQHSSEMLKNVADQLNRRPRKTLSYQTPQTAILYAVALTG